MVEAERLPVHLVAPVGPHDLTVVEVPVRDVAAGVAEDHVLEERGDEVDPALVDEDPVLDGDEAVAGETVRPPVQERGFVAPDRDEPEVVDPRPEEHLLARQQLVAGKLVQRVRREDDPALPGEGRDVVEGGEHLDVGVEVGHVVRVA